MMLRSLTITVIGLLLLGTLWAGGSRQWERTCAVSYDDDDVNIVHCHRHDSLALAGMILVPKELK